MIPKITKEELHDLSVTQLSGRMDSILEANEIERYGPRIQNLRASSSGKPSISKILNTAHVQNMSTDQQRAICYLTFNTLIQMEYTSVTSACSNTIIYGPNFDDKTSWSSVEVQVNNAALKQFGIISSRISMECFMELLHYLGEGERIKSKKSTFKSFKKWLNNPENPFSYFATHILRAFLFDREFRTPEVHASSKISLGVLRMKKPTSEDQNQAHQLSNVMLNVWQNLIEILNDGKTYSMQGSEEDFEWLKSYLHDNSEDKSLYLKSIFEQMQ